MKVDFKKLRAIRELRKYSQEELARKTGLSAETIRRVENGKTQDPGIITLSLITKALLIDLKEILIEGE